MTSRNEAIARAITERIHIVKQPLRKQRSQPGWQWIRQLEIDRLRPTLDAAVMRGTAEHETADAEQRLTKANAKRAKASKAIKTALDERVTVREQINDYDRRAETVMANYNKGIAQLAKAKARREERTTTPPDYAALARTTDDPDLAKAYLALEHEATE